MKSADKASEEPGKWSRAFQNRREQQEFKRQAILRTAAALFSEHGFNETTLDAVAEHLGVTKPTLYYYTRSKSDILVQCLDEALSALEAQGKAIIASEQTGAQKMRRFIHAFVGQLDDELGRCVAWPGRDPLDARARKQIDPIFSRIDRQLRVIVDQGAKDGSLSEGDPMLRAFILFGAMNWVTRWYRQGGRYSARDIADEIADCFLRGIEA